MNRKLSKCLMLDIGRKYFSPGSIKEIIDTMSDNKMDSLSLHFSEDMGLGIECPRYDFLAGRDGMLCPFRELGSVHPDESYLSIDELANIIGYANAKGIEVIPSYDSPGHLNYTVKKLHERVQESGNIAFHYKNNEYGIKFTDGYYEFYKNGKNLCYPKETSGTYGIGSYFSLDGEVSRVKGTNNCDYSRGIDITNEVAVAFVQSILESYAKLFYDLGCRTIDLGCDELLGYSPAIKDTSVVPKWRQLETWEKEAKRRSGLESAVAYDLFVMYMNENCKLVKNIGYENIYAWNDEFRLQAGTGWTTDPTFHIQFEKGITVQYWEYEHGRELPEELIQNGYNVISVSSKYCYYVLIDEARSTPPTKYTNVTPDGIMDGWNPYITEKAAEFCQNSENGVVGCMFCVWCDCPVIRTDYEVADDLKPLLEAWSKKADKVCEN